MNYDDVTTKEELPNRTRNLAKQRVKSSQFKKKDGNKHKDNDV
jgi:hypothetical protein